MRIEIRTRNRIVLSLVSAAFVLGLIWIFTGIDNKYLSLLWNLMASIAVLLTLVPTFSYGGHTADLSVRSIENRRSISLLIIIFLGCFIAVLSTNIIYSGWLRDFWSVAVVIGVYLVFIIKGLRRGSWLVRPTMIETSETNQDK